jgi:hypothetical protein
MKGIKLNREDRRELADNIMQWGNLVFGGLVIAQFVPSEGNFHPTLILAGVLNILLAYGLAILIMSIKGGEVN